VTRSGATVSAHQKAGLQAVPRFPLDGGAELAGRWAAAEARCGRVPSGLRLPPTAAPYAAPVAPGRMSLNGLGRGHHKGVLASRERNLAQPPKNGEKSQLDRQRRRAPSDGPFRPTGPVVGRCAGWPGPAGTGDPEPGQRTDARQLDRGPVPEVGGDRCRAGTGRVGPAERARVSRGRRRPPTDRDLRTDRRRAGPRARGRRACGGAGRGSPAPSVVGAHRGDDEASALTPLPSAGDGTLYPETTGSIGANTFADPEL
jgi:hypothetical protein